MKALLVQPFAESTPLQRKILVLAMVLQGLLACNYHFIPMIFYRPKFYCGEGLTVSVCNELDACIETPLKFQSDYTFTSISMDFGLYCDRKQIEATILTFMMLGHFVGAFLSSYLSDLGHHKRSLLYVLMINALISGLCCLAAGLGQSTLFVGSALAVWSLCSEMIMSFLSMVPMLYFGAQRAKGAFILILTCWSPYAMLAPTFLSFHLSWRSLLIFNLAVPLFLWVAYLWRSLEQLSDETVKLGDIGSNLLANGKEQSHNEPGNKQKQPIIVSYGDLYASPYFKNIALYLVVYSGSYLAGMTSLLTINGIAGNLYVNLTITTAIQILLSLTGGYIANSFSMVAALKFIYLVVGITYGLYSLLPSFLQFYVVIQGKLLTDITWVMLSSLIIVIAPAKFIPLIISSRAILNITVGLIIPYVKYFMELIRLSLFVFSSLYELTAYLSLTKIQIINA